MGKHQIDRRRGPTGSRKLEPFSGNRFVRAFNFARANRKVSLKVVYHARNWHVHVATAFPPFYGYLVHILNELLNEDKPSEAEESDEMFLCAMSIVGQCLHHFTRRRIIAALHPKSFDPANIGRIADHNTLFSLAGIREIAEGKSR